MLQAGAESNSARLRSFLLPVFSAAIAVYIGVHAGPLVGTGSLQHASVLLGAKEAFLRRSGCDRLTALFHTSAALADQAAAAGVHTQLLALLQADDPSVVAAAAAALAAFAKASPAAVQALQGAPGLLALHGLAASQPVAGEPAGEAAARTAAREALRAVGAITVFS